MKILSKTSSGSPRLLKYRLFDGGVVVSPVASVVAAAAIAAAAVLTALVGTVTAQTEAGE